MTSTLYRPHCQICLKRGAKYRAALHEGMHADDQFAGVPLPDGSLVTYLCDDCFDTLMSYWLEREHLDGAAHEN